MPRPRHQPTDKTRAEVQAYAMVGVPHHDLARLVQLSIKTLLKYYRDELDTGKARATAQVGRSLFRMATTGNNVAAAIFWMKAQAGWREKQLIEHTGADGDPLNPPDVHVTFTTPKG